MPRRPCGPMRPTSRTTRPGATGTDSSPCQQNQRWWEAYLAAAGEGYAMPTLRRRVAAIARACGVAGYPLDTKHPAIRETLRGIGRRHGSPSRRAAAITTTEIRKLCRICGTNLAGSRDRALFLLGFAARCAALSSSGWMWNT